MTAASVRLGISEAQVARLAAGGWADDDEKEVEKFQEELEDVTPDDFA